MFSKILIANRGEIACRVMRTAKAMGIATVAVYSDADARSPHVMMADEAVRLGPPAASESYLRADLILLACKETGAEAVHPGYGFLSERESFAQLLDDNGIAFIGPPPKAIAAMGDKIESKKLAEKAGVSVVPGFIGEIRDTDHAVEIAGGIGYPVMMKASAGGGGKGMRLAYSETDVREGFEATKREGLASFGDDRVFIEKFVESPRHIEIQLLGDQHGNMVYLGERECSVQRRHQKVVEEAPSPFVKAICAAAVKAAKVALAQAVGYFSAGTVEFIAGADRSFYFLEMNTRLQVEHPVTEMVTGLDLVEKMIRVAAGEPLGLTQDDVKLDGWAIESRVYAEDPYRGFLPSTGRLVRYRPPVPSPLPLAGGEQGDVISPYYDPMIAKLIAHGSSREIARQRLLDDLTGAEVWPVRTNAGFLHSCLSHRLFVEEEIDTGLIARELDSLLPAEQPSQSALDIVASALALEHGRDDAVFGIQAMRALSGFRLNAAMQRDQILYANGKVVLGRRTPASDQAQFETKGGPVNGGWLIVEKGQTYFVSTFAGTAVEGSAVADGAILSPMPGRIIAVEVAAGASVAKGQKLVTLEAMKMEHSLVAPFDGTVAELNAEAGAQVSEGTLLVRIEKGEE